PETDASDRLSGSGPSQRPARDRWSNLQQCNADNNPACRLLYTGAPREVPVSSPLITRQAAAVSAFRPTHWLRDGAVLGAGVAAGACAVLLVHAQAAFPTYLASMADIAYITGGFMVLGAGLGAAMGLTAVAALRWSYGRTGAPLATVTAAVAAQLPVLAAFTCTNVAGATALAATSGLALVSLPLVPWLAVRNSRGAASLAHTAAAGVGLGALLQTTLLVVWHALT
ncbi:MAG: hypothetical protein ACI8PZ_005340, partial [Myxococcota bacterium]